MTNKSDNPREKLYRKVLHSRWVKIVSAMASVVVFVTVYALILPAITLTNQEPKCNVEEHTHVAECYDAEGNVVCGTEEHVHKLTCYSDLNAAIENEEYWAAELPGLTGDRNADVIAVAETQIGYKENDENYKVVDNEQKKGYTRYGHWYGEEVDTSSEKLANGLSDYAYKDWDAMFVSFVLRYAEIYDLGFDSDAGNWAGALSDAAIYVNAADYVPQMGDLIFFTPNAGENMRVGIVSGVNRGFFGNEIKSISVILGDSNNAVEEVKVAVSEYTEGDITFETIHGYGVLTPGYGEQEATAEPEVTEENENTDVAVAAPEETEVVVPEDESTTDVSVAEEASVSLEESAGHLIGQTEESLETVDEASAGEVTVELVDAGTSEDASEIVMNWNMSTYLPEAILPAGSIIRIDTSTGKTHAMTVEQVRDWAQAAAVGADNMAYVDNESFEVTFIGDNGLLYTWDDVQNMDAATVTSFTGIHIKALKDVALGDDGGIFFGFTSMAKVVDANAGQNYYVSKVTVNGVSGTETYVYTNGEAETVDQNAVLRDAGLEETPVEISAEKTLTVKKTDYTVTMTYGPEAGIPDGAKLYVQEIRQGTEEYNRYIEEARAALGISEEDAAELLGRFFDIKIMTKEGEFEPKAPVNVNIEYKKAVETGDASAVSAVHFSKDGAESIPVETVDVSEAKDEMAKVKSVEFSADSFSVYGVVYTVDFETVDGGTYSIPGSGSYKLNDLLPNIIGKNGVVTSAELKLVEGEEIEGALYLTTDDKGQYWINSDVAFKNVYELAITVDGIKHIVRVTDVQGTNLESITTLTGNVSPGTTVSYDGDKEEYSAHVAMQFTVDLDTINNYDGKFYIKLASGIDVPDNELNKNRYAIDRMAGMNSFKYKFVKEGNNTYIEIEYLAEYLDTVTSVGENKISADVLFGHLQSVDEDNSSVKITDDLDVNVPNGIVEYPENADEHNDIHASKSYSGVGTGVPDGGTEEVSYVEYTVTVSSKKGTQGAINISDTLTDLSLKVNNNSNGYSLTAQSAKVISVAKTPNGSASVSNFTNDGATFSGQLPQLGAGQSYVITYRYYFDKKLPEGEAGQQFKVEASGNNAVTATSGTQHTGDNKSFNYEKDNNPVNVEKDGEFIEGQNKIKWTITLTLRDNVNHIVADDMFKGLSNSDFTVKKNDSNFSGYTLDSANGTMTFNGEGTYTIEYYTDAQQSYFSKGKVNNRVQVDGNNNYTKDKGVDIPIIGKDSVTKEPVEKEYISTTDNVEEYLLTWNVYIDLPSSIPKGTVIKDTLSYQHGWNTNTNTGKSVFTEDQKNAFMQKLEAVFGQNVFDVTWSEDLHEISLTFKNDWSGTAQRVQISYQTTGYEDLTTAIRTPGDSVGKDAFKNTFNVGDASATAEFTYVREVNKYDNADRSGTKVTTHNVTKSDKVLHWVITVNPQDSYNAMTITDTLPKGLTIKDIHLGTEYNNALYQPDENGVFTRNDSNNYMADWLKSMTATKSGDGTTSLVIDIEKGQESRPNAMTPGNIMYIFVDAEIDDSEFDGYSAPTKEYLNQVSVTADGKDKGSDDQTQKVTLESRTMEKSVTNPRWADYHYLDYVVKINKYGFDLLSEDTTYTVDDVLEFNKLTPEGKEITAMLVPNSVKLQQLKAGKTDGNSDNADDWEDYTGEWSYQFVESKDGDKREKTITVSGVPDAKPMRLLYTYHIELDGIPEGDKNEHDLGDLINKATLYGDRETSTEHKTEEDWKQFSSEASTVSGPTLTIGKVDIENFNNYLAGARFVLEKYNGTGWEIVNAISEDSVYLKTEDDAQYGAIAGHKVYEVISSGNRKGTLRIYQPKNEPKFSTDTVYRVREYKTPTGGYSVSQDPEMQPAGYFYFSGANAASIVWPNERIHNLADDLSKESDTFYMTNAKTPSLKITKKFVGDGDISDTAKKALQFVVYNSEHQEVATLTYADVMSNKNVITNGIVEGQTYTVVEKGLNPNGTEWTVTYTANSSGDLNADTSAANENNNYEVTIGNVKIENNIGTVAITNKYDNPKTSVKVTKKWLNADGTENTNPEVTTVKFQLYQMAPGELEGSPYIPRGASEPVTYELTYNEGWPQIEIDNLPKYVNPANISAGEYSYYVVETEPNTGIETTYKIGEGGTEVSAADAAVTDNTNSIVIVNRDAMLTVTKKFVDKYGDEKTPANGTQIKFKVKSHARRKWDPSTIDVRDVTGDITLQYNAADQKWYQYGTSEEYTVKLPAETDSYTYLDYFIEEDSNSSNGYSVSYLINGQPQSDTNMITTDKNYQAVIVNAEQPDDSEITVKKVWDGAQNNEKESINIELWAVPKQDSSMSGDEKITVVVATDYYIGSADSLFNYGEGTRKITLTPNKYGGVSINNSKSQRYEYKVLKFDNWDWNHPLMSGTIESGETKNISDLSSDTAIIILQNDNVSNNCSLSLLDPVPVPTDSAYKTTMLSDNNSWKDSFTGLRSEYTYYIKETNNLDGFVTYYEYTDSDGVVHSGTTADEDAMTGSLSSGGVTVTNYKPPIGALKFTKEVTINQAKPTMEAQYQYVDGTYSFTITGPTSAPASERVTKYVRVTIENGVVKSYKVSDVDDNNAWRMAITKPLSEQDKWVLLPDLMEGDYIIRETQPTNGTEISKINGQDSNVNYTTVTVVAGDHEAEQAFATFTNNITKVKDFEFDKDWYVVDQPTDPSNEWPEDKTITVTVHRRIGTDADDSNFSLTYTIDGNLVTGSEIAEANDLSKPKLVVSNAEQFKFKLSGLDFFGKVGETSGEYTYYVTEATVDGYKDPEYESAGIPTSDGAHNGGKIINRPYDAVSLPETGGMGTTTYRIAGIITIFIAFITLILNIKRKRWYND